MAGKLYTGCPIERLLEWPKDKKRNNDEGKFQKIDFETVGKVAGHGNI
jgi:hypothetical protein